MEDHVSERARAGAKALKLAAEPLAYGGAGKKVKKLGRELAETDRDAYQELEKAARLTQQKIAKSPEQTYFKAGRTVSNAMQKSERQLRRAQAKVMKKAARAISKLLGKNAKRMKRNLKRLSRGVSDNAKASDKVTESARTHSHYSASRYCNSSLNILADSVQIWLSKIRCAISALHIIAYVCIQGCIGSAFQEVLVRSPLSNAACSGVTARGVRRDAAGQERAADRGGPGRHGPAERGDEHWDTTDAAYEHPEHHQNAKLKDKHH